jgi:outer membrane protein TolC
VWPTTSLGAGTVLHSNYLIMIGHIPIPVTGTLAAARRGARAELGVARAEESGADFDLRREVVVAWIELAHSEAAATIADDAAAREGDLATVVHKRFDVKDASKAEVVAADAAAARAKAEAGSSHVLVEGASAALAGLLGWDPVALLHAEGGLPAPEEPPSLAELRSHVAIHPEVAQAAARIDVVGAELHSLAVENRPQFAFEFEVNAFGFIAPAETLVDTKLILTVEFPFGGRYAEKRAAALQRERAARTEKDAAQRSSDGALVAAYRRWQAAASRARSLEADVLPAQREATRLASLAYKEGGNDLTAVLQQERALLDAEREAADARAESAAAYADVQWAMGIRP